MKPDVLIVGGGMITHDQILPSLYHLQRLGVIGEIGSRVPRDVPVLFVYGGGSIKRNGVYDQVVAALKNHRVIEFLQGRVKGAFGVANEHLKTHSFMLGERPTIADLSMVGYLYYPEQTGIERSAFPHLEAWVQRISNLPRWQPPYALMPRGLVN